MIATPVLFLAWLIPVQVLLAALDSLRGEAKARWLAALLPATMATVLILMLAENFARTVFDYGIGDTRGIATVICLALVMCVALWMWQSEALALSRGLPHGASVVAAAAVVLLAAVGWIIAARPAGASVGALLTRDPIRRPNILLVGFDGVTAKMTSPYGASGSTPNLNALARRGIVFENAFSNAGHTYWSVTSMLTGKSPIDTPALLVSHLEGADSVEHLPRLLRAAGYKSAQAGVGRHVDANDANMKGGFDLVNGRAGLPASPARDISKLRDRLDLYRGQLIRRVADRVPHILLIRMMHDEYRFLVGEAVDIPHFADARRLELSRSFIEQGHEPWFVHVHLVDAHGCKDCDRAARKVDATLGQLVEFLRALRQLDRTLILVYSDHSDTWSTTERLPLVIVPPGGMVARRIRNNAQMIDIAPTILGYLGLSKPQWMSGVSLLEGEPDARRPVMSVAPFAEPKIVGVVICDRWGTLDPATRSFRSGFVADHTAPCAMGSAFEKEGLALLADALRRNGTEQVHHGLESSP